MIESPETPLEEKSEAPALSPYRIVSVAGGGGAFPSDERWGRRFNLALDQAELLEAMIEGVRLCADCVRGKDPLAGFEPAWSDEGWDEMNQILSSCAAVLGKTQGAKIFEGARPRAGGRDGLVFNKKSWRMLEDFFKSAMALPKEHFKMAVWSLMEAGCDVLPASFGVEKSPKPFFPSRMGVMAIERMAEAAGALQTPTFDAVGLARDTMVVCWRTIKSGYGPKDGPYIGLAHTGVPNAWEACSGILDALLVKEELSDTVRSRRSKRSLESAQTPRL